MKNDARLEARFETRLRNNLLQLWVSGIALNTLILFWIGAGKLSTIVLTLIALALAILNAFIGAVIYALIVRYKRAKSNRS